MSLDILELKLKDVGSSISNRKTNQVSFKSNKMKLGKKHQNKELET